MSRSAIVIGGGFAGMLAASALSQSVDKVTVLERDTLADVPQPRKGLPQGHHAHVLLPSGRDAIDALIPGVSIRKRLLAAGAHEASLTSLITLGSEGWFRRWGRQEHLLLTASRDLLDWTVRDAVLGTPGVGLRTGQAVALLGNAARVTGVRVSDADGEEAELSADLVIDASGRGSRAVRWLGDFGITGIPESIVDSGLVYASRLYRVPEGAETFPVTQVTADPFASQPGRSANLVPIEGNRWLVSLGGTRGGEPPADSEGFVRFARDVRHPIVGQLISGAEPLSAVTLTRSTRNGRRFFEKARSWPERFVVLGDAVATYNPVYGQGMSVAALGAQAIHRELQQRGVATPGFARHVQRAVAKPVAAAWAMSTSQDRWFPGVQGSAPTALDRLLTRYTRRMTRVATTSHAVSTAMCAVTTLQEDAIRLVRPFLLRATLAGPVMPALSGPPLTEDERAMLHALDRSEEEAGNERE